MGAIQSVGDVRQRVECGRRGAAAAASGSPSPDRYVYEPTLTLSDPAALVRHSLVYIPPQ